MPFLDLEDELCSLGALSALGTQEVVFALSANDGFHIDRKYSPEYGRWYYHNVFKFSPAYERERKRKNLRVPKPRQVKRTASQKASDKKYYQKNKAKIQAYYKSWKERKLAERCKETSSDAGSGEGSSWGSPGQPE